MQEEVAENLSRVCVYLEKEKKKEKRRKHLMKSYLFDD